MITGEPRKLGQADLALAGIPEAYWKAKLSDFPDAYKGIRCCRAFSAKVVENLAGGYGLMLMGPMGNGKTHAAAALLKDALRHNASGLFLEVPRITEARIHRITFGHDSEKTLMQRAEEVDLLLLDDLGCEHTTEFTAQTIEALVRARISRRRSLIVTTNLTKGLSSVYGSGTLSVLRERVYPFPFEGRDWREQQFDDLRRRFECHA